MTPDPKAGQRKAMLLVWWIIWGSILSGLVLLYVFLVKGPEKPGRSGDILVNLIALVPLFVSIVVRWLILPRFTDIARATPVFIIGVALAESCGILGMFLGGAYRDDLFLLGVLGVTQYIPLLTAKHHRADKGQFIPNN